ncbi:MAG TPA: T9SS type A sorting domain-containing protein, partial [Bacteroidetes bacterium]|nr:T9SS type A sorting domain-containing protein [Bacteroidota bacterium]
YRINYGTPFDLDSLEDNDFLDKNNVKLIKIVDVIGSLDNNYATFDSKGNKVNDPFPTPFNTGGFDLDAVGIIHQKNIDNTTNLYSTNAILYPNPASDFLMIDAPFSVEEIVVISLNGKIVYKEKSFKTTIDISSLTEGNYIVVLHGKNTILTKKLFKL